MPRRFLLIAILFVACHTDSDAQTANYHRRPPASFNKKIDSLLAGNDTVLLFCIEYAGPKFNLQDTCGLYDDYFLIWQSGDIVNYQQINMDAFFIEYCYTPVVPHRGSAVFKILKEHSKKIKSEVLRPFIARIEWQGDVYYQEMSTSHPVYYRLQFYWQRQDADVPGEFRDNPAMVKQIRNRDLEEKQGAGIVNLNYPYNHNSRTMLLMYRIMAEIEELNLDGYLRKSPQTDK